MQFESAIGGFHQQVGNFHRNAQNTVLFVPFSTVHFKIGTQMNADFLFFTLAPGASAGVNEISVFQRPT
jgi:peptidase E